MADFFTIVCLGAASFITIREWVRMVQLEKAIKDWENSANSYNPQPRKPNLYVVK